VPVPRSLRVRVWSLLQVQVLGQVLGQVPGQVPGQVQA
jgi:hypothetical protein